MKLAFVAIAGFTCMPIAVSAQQMPPVPVDKEVRIGKLDNGLTYYIRHNEYPKNQVDFYIAQKVGSILEEDTSADWRISLNTCVSTEQGTSRAAL